MEVDQNIVPVDEAGFLVFLICGWIGWIGLVPSVQRRLRVGVASNQGQVTQWETGMQPQGVSTLGLT